MESDRPYSKLSLTQRLRFERRLQQPSEASTETQPTEASIETQPSKADKVLNTSSESDSDEELFNYDPNFEIKISAKRQRIKSQSETNTTSKHHSETSDSDDDELDFATATSAMSESSDSELPSTTNTETQRHSENDDELDELESSDDENKSSDDEHESSDDENHAESPIEQMNPPAMEMFAEVFVDILLDFIDKHNNKLGIISSENPKERLRSILMGTEKSFEDMPAMFDIILLVLHFVSSVCGDMEDGGLDMDAFASNKAFHNDFLDDIFAFLEPFSGLFSNKRLNNHHDMKTHRFAASTLLEFLYGRIDLTEDEIKLYCALVLGGFLDGDAHVSLESYRSTRWIDGETKSPLQNNVNYHCAGEFATLEEILKYLLEHPTRIHLGHAPIIVWSMCSVYGIRSSPFAIAIMDFLNSAYGEPEGGVLTFFTSDKYLRSKGYLKTGNSICFSAASTEGQGSALESRKIEFARYLLKTVIIKYAEMENIQNFPACGWYVGSTLSGIRQKVPEKTPAEIAARETAQREMSKRDKQLKLDRKEICSNGLADEPVKMYKERLGKLNQSGHLGVIKSLPHGSIHINNLFLYIAGLGMAEGSITEQRASIGQVNFSFNEALSQEVEPYIGRLKVYGNQTHTRTCLQTVIFLLAVGMHYSHRKEQVIIGLFYHLFCRHLATGVKVDLQFVKEKITEKWQSMDNENKAKHSATFKKWMEDEGRNREYDESNGFVDDNEIESMLKVLEKVLIKLLQAYKAKDPS